LKFYVFVLKDVLQNSAQYTVRIYFLERYQVLTVVSNKVIVVQDMMPFSVLMFLTYLSTKLQGIISQKTTILNLIPS
jgi:hypothetical protein